MQKVNFPSWLLLLVIFMIVDCQNQDQDARKPNILFISIDDLRPTLGVYGDSIAITPHIDQLASEGFTFRETFTQSAVCAPSRASLMTGLRPDSTRVWHLGNKFREINPQTVTMPQYFSKHGYHT
ncbi:MAG: sulfatase-like hydrolase/transferase, partial [Saprospiraceae bacterium]|nr:sulfatase-like hydrolase/transferase [Saprospiraceae bacterium]